MKHAALPPIYIRNGRECYLDPIRKKLIYITPEETVRQQIVSDLLKKLHVPPEMIAVEEHLSHYGVKSRDRADIIIHGYVKEDNARESLAVIECKAPNVFLDERAVDQMVRYADALVCRYAVLTNGTDTYNFVYDESCNEYKVIEALPSYEDMLEGKYSIVPEEPIHERIPFDSLLENADAFVGWDIGKDTRKEVAFPCMNLSECLLDLRRKLPVGEYGIFKLVEDYGVRALAYGDASGGTYDALYRSFLIDYNESTEFVSIAVSTYVTWAHPDIEKTVINVAIDNEESAHHALQLVADDNFVMNGNKCIFYHHGRIAIGNIGSGKVDELRQFVADKCPDLIDGKRFNLGALVNDHLWYLDEPEVINLIKNLISYALIRDEYRKYIKENMK